MSFLDTIFRKGRMGRTISRAETIERLNPIVEKQVWLNHYYDHVVEHLEHRRLAEHLGEEQRTARNDVAKINETILSAGGQPFSGTAIEPDEIEMAGNDVGLLYQLLDAERDLHDAIAAESEVEHQMRTRAILGVVKTNSERRLKALHDATEGRRRPEDVPPVAPSPEETQEPVAQPSGPRKS